MKLTVTVFFGLVLVMLAVSVSGKPRPKTYLVDTVDSKEVEDALAEVLEKMGKEGADYTFNLPTWLLLKLKALLALKLFG